MAPDPPIPCSIRAARPEDDPHWARVPFLEGWFVPATARRCGVGCAWIQWVAAWARQQGYQELASGVELDNRMSQKVPEQLGFTETERTINYLLKLDA